MAKAKRSNESSIFTPFIEGAKKHVFDILNKVVQEKIKRLEELGMEIALGLIFFFIGTFFVFTSLVFFLREQYQFSYFQSFFGVGIVALLISVIIYKLIKKNG